MYSCIVWPDFLAVMPLTLFTLSEAEAALNLAEEISRERSKMACVSDDDLDDWDIKIYLAIARCVATFCCPGPVTYQLIIKPLCRSLSTIAIFKSKVDIDLSTRRLLAGLALNNTSTASPLRTLRRPCVSYS